MYYEKLHSMKREQVANEIRRLNDMLMRTRPSSPMYNQLLGYRDQAQELLNEQMSQDRQEKNPDEVIELGTIDSSVFTPEYNTDVLFQAVVQSYRSNHEPPPKQ